MKQSKLADAIIRLTDVLKTLRAPDGCPWDAAQTPETLKPYLLEETYEVLEAIDSGSIPAIREELGDLLLQVAFHAAIFAEQGDFDLADVASGIAEKLVRRHPHVFGTARIVDSAQLNRQWEAIKSAEKETQNKQDSPFATIPRELPSLLRAYKIIEKAERIGLDTAQQNEIELRRQTAKELDLLFAASDNEADAANRFGEILLSMVRLAHHLEISPEEALRQATGHLEKKLTAQHSARVTADDTTTEPQSRTVPEGQKHRQDASLDTSSTKDVDNMLKTM